VRIQATLASRCSGRLPNETETHLSRIAEEALTNVGHGRGLAAAFTPKARRARGQAHSV
jgi:hypothetical protein